MDSIRIGLLGAGNMAEALIGGWLRAGVCQASDVAASDVRGERLDELRERFGIATDPDNARIAARSDVVVVAVKPQVVSAVLAPLAGILTDAHLVVSIAAGVPIATFQAALGPGVRVVRTMPNTPALVGRGATAIAPGPTARPEDVALARRLFDAVGTTVTVSEPALDAVTGLSGSGPAYVMVFIEALADGGVKAGLPRDVALALATQTVLGSAELLARTGDHPGELKDRVTSPGGTTIAGLAELERRAVRGAVIDAVVAAAARSAELGRR